MAKRSTVVLLTLAMCSALLAAGAVPASGATPRSTLVGSAPPWATRARRRSDAIGTQKLRFRVYLALRNQAGAEQVAQAVSDPDSSSYGKFLSDADVVARYAPTTASVDSVRAWLKSAGLAAGYVPANRQFVEATGTVDQVEAAFGTTLGVYDYQGHHLRAPDGSLSVPSTLASTITSILGVDQGLSLLQPNHIGPERTTTKSAKDRSLSPNASPNASPNTVDPPDGFRNAQPCSAYYGQKVDTTDPAFGSYGHAVPYAPCGYTPPQLRSAYGIDKAVAKGIDGRGTTVAVIDAFAAPTILADAQAYAKKNDPQHPFLASKFKQVVYPTNPDLEGPDECDAAGWYGEETLDIEAVHAMAPGANILYVGGSDCNDVSLDKALNDVVAKHQAQIVSNSYGDLGEDIAPDEVEAFQQISIQAVLKGIGLYFSSGDDGDEVATLGSPSADFSASSPWVTAVGGTSLAIGKQGQKLFETGWETNKATLTDGAWSPATPPAPYLYGSGGGTSILFSEPWYQRGVVPDILAKKNQTGRNRGRVVPDISMVGDPNTGMKVGETQTFPDGVYYDEYRIGGTSLASPLFAGVMADSDQAHHRAHGFINPAIYRMARRGRGRSPITDVKHVKGAVIRSDYANGIDASDGLVTSLRGFDDQTLTIHTAPGYDDVTGLGTPDGLSFLLSL